MGGNSTLQAHTGDQAGELTLTAYLDVARRHKWRIILCGIGMFVSLPVFAHRLPDIYRTETVILVDSAQVPDKYVPTINTGDIAGRLTTLEQQVLSPTRLKKLVESEGLYEQESGKRTEEDVIRSVQKSIVVEVVNPGGGKMGAFRIAYSGRRREQVARIANRLAQMFIEENLRARVDQTEDTAQFLEEQLQETKRQLDDKETQLRGIKSHNIMELPESKPYHLEALANLRTQIQTTENKIQQDPIVEQQPAIPAQRQKRRNPVLEAQIGKLDEEVRDQKNLVGPLQSQLTFHESKLEQIPVFEQQIARLQSDYDILKLQYTGLLEKEKAAEISHALEVHQKGEKFEVLDPAVTPLKPAAPNRALISTAGLFGGLLLGIALAVMAEMNDESVRSEGEAARIMGKPVLCSVPQLVSGKEIRKRRLKGLGIFAGTLAGSAVFGAVLSFVSGRFF